MDESQVDALLDDLEASSEWSPDAAAAARDLLARLPVTPATEGPRARLALLSFHELVEAHGTAGAVVRVARIRDRAALRGERALQARAERTLSGLLRDVGDPAGALAHAVAALSLDGDDLDPVLRCRLRLSMADALGDIGDLDRARPRYREVLEHSTSHDLPWVSVLALNNWAYTELSAGRLGAADDLARDMQSLARDHGMDLEAGDTLTIIEVDHALGRSAEAITTLRTLLRDDRHLGSFDAAYGELLLARIERETGDLAAACTTLDTVDRLTTTHQLHGLSAEAQGERAELLAARGDHAGAYETHLRFHDETLALRTAASDARARTQHAMLEADQSRREAALYREMSYRDPLTGLLNRRHVDADLDHRLADGQSLAIALIDLDHFKAVNDTWSHEAGDAVLVRLATLLQDAVANVPDACAARLGGEEFLLVLPHHDLHASHTIADDLRHRIETSHWDDIAPGVPITASIGLAHTRSGTPSATSRAELLRDADTHLYAAKQSGRNRVEPLQTAPGAQGRGPR